jgi:hypothetical protein
LVLQLGTDTCPPETVHRISDGQLFLSEFFFFFVLLLNGVGLETSQGNLSSSKS